MTEANFSDGSQYSAARTALRAAFLLPLSVVFACASCKDTPQEKDTADSELTEAESETLDGSAGDGSADDGATDELSDTPDNDVNADLPDVPAEPCSQYLAATNAGTLPEVVNEASGLVVDPRDPTVLWLHNDSGGTAQLFAVRATAGLLATTTIGGAENTDWEDLSIGPCGDSKCLYIADVGNNGKNREKVDIYRIPLPDFNQDSTVTSEKMELAFPEEPFDCEALVVTDDESVILFSKEASISRAFIARFRVTEEPQQLTFLATTDFSNLGRAAAAFVTGASWNPTNHRLLLRMYTQLLEFRFGERTIVDLDSVPIVEVPTGFEIGGESVAYSPTGYYHVAEGVGPNIWRVECEP